MYLQEAARVHADELDLRCRHGCLFACVSAVPGGIGPKWAQDISRLRTCSRSDQTVHSENVEMATPASADLCVVACMYQKVARWVSDVPCPPRSDLGSPLKWLGGDVLIPGRMEISP